MSFNLADLFEHAVDSLARAGEPGRIAVAFGDERIGYDELEQRVNRFAHVLIDAGVRPGDHVGLYLRNHPAHVVAMLATYKVRAVPVNVNYRYVEAELAYLFDNADLVALVHDARFTPMVERVREHAPGLHTIVTVALDGAVDAGIGEVADRPDGAIDFATAIASGSPARDFPPRSDDDRYIVYTGGTTGYPKGVLWRHVDVWRTLGGGIELRTGRWLDEWDQSTDGVANPEVALAIGPLMHGGAQWGLLGRLMRAHTVVLRDQFDAESTWRAIDDEAVNAVLMIGDAMARPLMDAYDTGAYSGASLRSIASSAAILSPSVKRRLLEAFPGILLTDSIGSSETGYSGVDRVSVAGLTSAASAPRVSLGPETVIVDEAGTILDPDRHAGRSGRVARRGCIPIGYFKDPEKTAATFVEIDGVRYSIPGDWGRLEADGSVTFLGRGSNCINTGGEKVFPEEVERALKSHPHVLDALVFGLPDERMGERIAAVIEGRDGASPSLEDLQAHLRTVLSGYKLPREVVTVEKVPRHDTGKANYPLAKEQFAQARAQL